MLTAGMIVKMYGDLGAGKTTLVKGIARALSIPVEYVVSPSYTIITEYDSTPRLLHIDLYRIEGRSDLESTGIWDALSNDAIAVIEWPEHAGNELAEGGVVIRIEHRSENERLITIEGIDEEHWHNL